VSRHSQPPGSDPPPHTGGSYAALLRVPHVGSQALLGLLAELTQGAAPVGLVLVVHQATGSLISAGVVSAALWVGAAVARPIQGRLIDRHGTRIVMLACGPVHAAALAGVVLVAWAGGAAGAMVPLSAVAGLALPPVSVAMRVEWGRHVPANERTAAFSLVYLTQEIALVTGPLLIAALIGFGPGVGLITAAIISGVATAGFAALGTTEATVHEAPARTGGGRATSVPAVLAVAFLLGAMLGVFQVAAPSLAIARGLPAIGGVLIAAVSVGGITGAVLYGAIRWKADPATRLILLLALLAVATTALLAVLPLAAVGVLLAVGGLALNPAFATTSLLVDRHSGARGAEAFGWMSTAGGGGTAAGNAVAGALAQHNGFPPAFVAAAVAAYAAVLISCSGAWLSRSRIPRR
jgi:MFS family permease